MNVHWLKNRSSSSSPGIQEDAEIEALQTDVMRFMAILGFILAVIFALVQSLPFTPFDEQPLLQQQESLRQTIEDFKARIEIQQDTLKRIHQRITEAKALRAKTLSETQAIAERRDQALKQTEQLMAALDVTQQKLTTLKSQLERQEESLQRVRLKVEKEQRELEAIDHRLNQLEQSERMAQQLRDKALAAEQEAVRKKLAAQDSPRKEQAAAKPSPQRSVRASEPKREGFVLKFESDAAFNRLLAEGSIKFYAIAGSNAWQVRLKGTDPHYISAPSPSRYHEMERMTVPAVYLDNFKPFIAGQELNAVIWGVVLPAHLSQRIQSRIRDKRGGDVIIQPDGRIRLENANP